MDNLCQFVSKIINIDAERENYTKMYDYVRNALINHLRENPYFNELFCDLKLCGSYADNLKISKPNEFDLVVCLKLPFNELVKIVPDNKNRGNVLINISDVLKRLEEAKKENTRKFLDALVNSKKYLLQDKFQNWLEGCVARFFNKINRQLKYTDGTILHLQYRKQGPAHTVEVIKGSYEFSIDFVPAFMFESSKFKITQRTVTSTYWQAIPKPMGTKDNPSFRTSFTDSERTIFADKNQFKNTLRMMKKFRDVNPKMVNLKSYYIKTLFLWHEEWARSHDPGFWQKPTIEILHVMFDKLATALEIETIPFFWDKKLNMLQTLSKAQIKSMYHEVVAARKILMQPRGNFAQVFLTKEEQDEYLEKTPSDAVVMDELCQQISRVINIPTNKEVYRRYEHVRKTFISNLKENENLKTLFFDLTPRVCNAINNSNKYTVIIRFKLPFNELVKITPDSINRGRVFINISDVLKRLEEAKKENTRKFLDALVNSKKYLLQDKFQNWLESCVATFFNKTNKQLKYTDGSIMHLQYRKQGPAHTITVMNGEHRFSINFVPAFMFESSKFKVTQRPVTSTYWQAVPKPMGTKDNPSFQTSFEESERTIFANKNQFKNTLRMMKKFRDNKPKMVNLTNYHLMTLFLWHDEWASSNDPGFWQKPTMDILHVMFKKLVTALDKQEIPFFWDKKLNLLQILQRTQVESMYQEVRNAVYILMHPESPQHILNIFLNDAEISSSRTQSEDEIIADEATPQTEDQDLTIRRIPGAPRTSRHDEENDQQQEERRGDQEEIDILNNSFVNFGIAAAATAPIGFMAYRAFSNPNRKNQ